MIEITEHLRETVASILDTVSIVHAFLQNNEELNEDDLQQLSYCCAELSLLSLSAHDDIDEAGSPADRMIRHELASAFQQIAMHSINIQEWEHLDDIRAYFSTIYKHCTFISATLKMPIPEKAPSPIEESRRLIPAVKRLATETMSIVGIPLEGENQPDRLKAEIQALREVLIVLVLERDHLINVVCKEIESDYMEALGSLEAEIYRAECEVRYLKRVMELMQAAVNRREKPDMQEIDEKLKEQYEDYQRVYEAFTKRIHQASDYNSARKKKTESESRNPKNTESDGQRIKKLYRKIVKAMHPDLHPDQSEEAKELFKKALAAYEAGDLKTLIEISGTIEGKSDASAETEVEGLLREKAHICKLIKNIKAELQIIKSSYPYAKKELLNDHEKLAQEKEKLKNRLDRALRQAELYRRRIAEIKAWEN